MSKKLIEAYLGEKNIDYTVEVSDDSLFYELALGSIALYIQYDLDCGDIQVWTECETIHNSQDISTEGLIEFVDNSIQEYKRLTKGMLRIRRVFQDGLEVAEEFNLPLGIVLDQFNVAIESYEALIMSRVQ